MQKLINTQLARHTTRLMITLR